MGTEIAGAEESTPQGVRTDREDTPTRFARVRIETSEVKAEMAVPSSQTRRLLVTILDALVVLGAVLGPVLTLEVVPATFPTWATAGTIGGQLAMLAFVALSVHHQDKAG
ncbi:hypothetical protein ACFWY9_39225 [Amycolatopsis sp. NPDC059027]|uniref:hypothetical protein n=1 Tax=unclassified Amycolatopsis TaxID=2618356 RepID=UPI00367107E0